MSNTDITPDKETNLDDLAVAIANGFHEVGSRFDEVGGRLDRLEHEMKQVKSDLAAVRFTLTELAYKDEVRDHDVRLQRIEKHLGLAPAK